MGLVVPGSLVLGPSATGWVPSSLSGLSMWMDGRASAYSDTSATVPATSPLGRVRKIAQPLPLTGYWTASSDAIRPVRSPQGVECVLVPNGTGLTSPTPAVAIPGNNATIGLSFVLRGPALTGTHQALFVGVLGGDSWGPYLYFQTYELQLFRGGGNGAFATGITIPAGTQVAVVIRYKTTGAIDVRALVGGVEYSASESHTLSSANLVSGSALISLAGNWQLGADVSQCVVAAGACSDTDRVRLLTWLADRAPAVTCPTGAPLLSVLGDSIAVGGGALEAWSYLVMDNLYTANAGVGVRLVNTAVSGHTLAQMKADYIQYVRPLYSASRTSNVCVLAGGVNDIRVGSDSAAFAAFADLAQTVRGDGFRTVAQTIANATSPNVDPVTFDPRQSGYNGAMRSVALTGGTAYSITYPVLADALADVQAVPQLANPSDTTYFTDGLHWTAAGQSAARPTYQAGIALV